MGFFSGNVGVGTSDPNGQPAQTAPCGKFTPGPAPDSCRNDDQNRDRHNRAARGGWACGGGAATGGTFGGGATEG